jgi:hypothetical protein
VNKAQLLQKVATAIAKKGQFLINFKNGIDGGVDLKKELQLLLIAIHYLIDFYYLLDET